jgi:hypothetical protein
MKGCVNISGFYISKWGDQVIIYILYILYMHGPWACKLDWCAVEVSMVEATSLEVIGGEWWWWHVARVGSELGGGCGG